MVLAEAVAESIEEALDFYERGVAAAERALGDEVFVEWEGRFWGHAKTRPYMRARLGMATTLWELGDAAVALDHLEEMPWLDEDDWMGVRYVLVRYCLERFSESQSFEARDYVSEYAGHWRSSHGVLRWLRKRCTRRMKSSFTHTVKIGER